MRAQTALTVVESLRPEEAPVMTQVPLPGRVKFARAKPEPLAVAVLVIFVPLYWAVKVTVEPGGCWQHSARRHFNTTACEILF